MDYVPFLEVHNKVINGTLRPNNICAVSGSRGVGSIFKVGGQDQKLFLWMQKVGWQISLFKRIGGHVKTLRTRLLRPWA